MLPYTGICLVQDQDWEWRGSGMFPLCTEEFQVKFIAAFGVIGVVQLCFEPGYDVEPVLKL